MTYLKLLKCKHYNLTIIMLIRTMLIKFYFVLVLYYSKDMQNRTTCSDIMVYIHENHSLENYVSFLGKEQP